MYVPRYVLYHLRCNNEIIELTTFQTLRRLNLNLLSTQGDNLFNDKSDAH